MKQIEYIVMALGQAVESLTLPVIVTLHMVKFILANVRIVRADHVIFVL